MPELPEAGRGECSDVMLEEEAEEGGEVLLVGLTGVLGLGDNVSCSGLVGLGVCCVVVFDLGVLGPAEDGLV